MTVPKDAGEKGSHYDAFISYSRAADGKLAPALHSALLRFAKPWYRRRAVRVFRDKISLSAAPGLWPSIERALGASKYFILLASPEARKSEWVAKEVEYWLRNKSPETMLIVLTDGAIRWDPGACDFVWPDSSALPEGLRGAFADEPLYVDLRDAKAEARLSRHHPQFLDALADLSAAVRAIPKDELVGEDIRQHRNTRWWITGVGSALLTLTIAAGLFWYRATIEENRATARSLAARSELLVGQRGVLLETAALLAIEAMKRSPSLESDQAIRRALALLPKRVADMPCSVGGDVREAAFHPDGKYLATWAADDSIRVWETATGRWISSLGMPGVRNLVLSPTLPVLAALDGTGATLWNFESGGGRRLPHPGARDVAYSHDGRLLVSVGSDSILRMWHGAGWDSSGVLLLAERKSAGPMHSVAVGSGTYHVMAWNDDIAELFRLRDRGVLWTVPLIAAGFQFSPDGNLLAVLNLIDRSMTLLDLQSRQTLLFEEGISDLAFSDDGGRLALGSPMWSTTTYDLRSCNLAGADWVVEPDGTVRREEREGRGSCSRLRPVFHDNSVYSVALSGDGRYVGTASHDRTARVWEANHGREVLRLVQHADSSLQALSFSADGRLVSGWGPKTCRTWEATGQRQVVAIPHRDMISDVAFSADGRRIATVTPVTPGGQGSVHVWALPSGRQIFGFGGFRDEGPRSVAISRDGSRILVDGTYLWNVAMRPGAAPPPRTLEARWAAVSLDSHVGVEVVNDSGLAVADLDTGNRLVGRPPYPSRVVNVVMSEDGCCIASVLEGNEVRVWYWKTGEEGADITLGDEMGPPNLSRGGRALVALDTARRRSVTVWKVGTGRRVTIPHEVEVTSAALDSSGSYVVITSEDATVRVWSVEPRAPVAQLAHDGDVITARFSPDGRYLLSAGGRSDRTARLWLWRPPDLIAEACSLVSRELTPQEWKEYVGGKQRAACVEQLDQEPIGKGRSGET